MIKQVKGKYHLYSKDGSKHLGGPYDTRGEAEERERQVNYHKNKAEVSMVITKASLQPDGSMRWQAVTSDTSPDSTGESTSLGLFQDWNERIDKGLKVDWLPPPREPFLGVSHYSDLEGFGEAGITRKRYIDGDRFRAAGTFRAETPIGPALFEAVRSEIELVRRGETVNQPIRISAAWWDIEHSHGPFIFTRKSLTDVCPMCARGEGNKIYLKGQLDHFAATRVPINPRTSLALQEKSEMGVTRKQDAASIIDEENAEELEKRSQLIGKSETESPAIVVKAKKPPEEEAGEEMDEDTEEKMEEESPKGKKKKPVGGSYMTDKGAITWQDAKALPEAKSFSRIELMGLVRRNIAGQPEEERLGLFEALLEDMSSELTEIKTAVEEMYLAQPAVEDDLLEPGEEEKTPMTTDYLDTFTQEVTEALESNQPAAQKAETIQKSLNAVALAIKAQLETPQAGGDMVAAFKAALAPLSDQLAQLNARLNLGPQQAVVLPVQKSVTVPTVNPQPQNQLPVSPVTGQPSSITAAVRATTIPGY